ncbi:MAG TPA: hypothetical protein VGH08_01775 [Chthoniobacterales bacterium]
MGYETVVMKTYVFLTALLAITAMFLSGCATTEPTTTSTTTTTRTERSGGY